MSDSPFQGTGDAWAENAAERDASEYCRIIQGLRDERAKSPEPQMVWVDRQMLVELKEDLNELLGYSLWKKSENRRNYAKEYEQLVGRYNSICELLGMEKL